MVNLQRALAGLISAVETVSARCGHMEAGRVCILQREMITRALDDAKTALANEELEARGNQFEPEPGTAA
jgi:hypothetical protein